MERICSQCHAVLAETTQADWCPACGGALVERKLSPKGCPTHSGNGSSRHRAAAAPCVGRDHHAAVNLRLWYRGRRLRLILPGAHRRSRTYPLSIPMHKRREANQECERPDLHQTSVPIEYWSPKRRRVIELRSRFLAIDLVQSGARRFEHRQPISHGETHSDESHLQLQPGRMM